MEHKFAEDSIASEHIYKRFVAQGNLVEAVRPARKETHTKSNIVSLSTKANENEILKLVSEYHSKRNSCKSHTPRMPTSLDDFEVICEIGSGSYGTCKKVRRKKDGKLMVWKEMDYGSMSETEKQMLVSEVNLLRELRHKNIVRYFDRIIDRGSTRIYILMEYCEGGDLAAIISKHRKEGTHMEEDFIWKILIQMTQSLKECHRRKNGKSVLHRDLKPANIFLDSQRNVKLGDFGLARVLQHDTSFAKTFVGTPYYMSPELVNNKAYNEKSDIWSLGCILYEMCALHPPFTASGVVELNKKIRVGEFARIPSRLSDDLNAIISKMLTVNDEKRPTINDILNDHLVLLNQCRLERSTSPQPDVPSETQHQLEDKLVSIHKQLQAKEKELDSRERSILLREKIADEKLKRAESLILENARLKKQLEASLDYGSRPHTPPSYTDSLPSPPCLHKEKRDPDTPKKKVSFGKENYKTDIAHINMYSNYANYDNPYHIEVKKRQELNDRLYKAKVRALELRSADMDTRLRPRLYHFR